VVITNRLNRTSLLREAVDEQRDLQVLAPALPTSKMCSQQIDVATRHLISLPQKILLPQPVKVLRIWILAVQLKEGDD
jgi:hypothetical protein